MHSKLARSILLLLGIVRLGCGAPAPSAEKRRESTPEVLDLEQELKKQAGEDKKFYPNQHSVPIPQIDGLEDNPPIELLNGVAAARAAAEAQETGQNPEAQLQEVEQGEQHDKEETDEDEGKEEIEKEEEIEEEEPANQEDDGQASEQTGSEIIDGANEDEAQEASNELLEEEDDRKAFLDGLMDSLERHPELLSQLMQGNEMGMEFDGENQNELLDNQDVADAIRAEVMSAMRGDGANEAQLQPIDEELGSDNGAAVGESEGLEEELANQAGDEEKEEEEEDGGGEEDEQGDEYYESLLKEIANRRSELLRENMQTYIGDKTARVVAKKRGYAPPPGYEPMGRYGDQDPELSMQAENNIADELEMLRNYWERVQQEEEEAEEEEQQPQEDAEEEEEEEDAGDAEPFHENAADEQTLDRDTREATRLKRLYRM